ncbi:glycosyl hydrolases 18 family protein, partial [Vibrio parahaemolyticus AQ3810]
VWYG